MDIQEVEWGIDYIYWAQDRDRLCGLLLMR